MQRLGRWVLGLALGTVVPLPAAVARQSGPRAKDPKRAVTDLVDYPVLDSVEGSFVNLNAVPVRPLAVDGASHVYAVNTHDSTVVHFDASGPGPAADTFRVPWGPVSIALWPGTPERLLVACRGTSVLAILDKMSGEIETLLELPVEPADVLVDAAAARAFVSCSGADAVVEVDLAARQIVTTHSIPGKHPVFLSFDAGQDVLVAPLISGNNSSAEDLAGPRRAGAVVLDLSDPAVALVGLPDEDLFRIVRATSTVEVVARGLGTILAAHGRNPVTGSHWILNTDARNTDPAMQSEPTVRGLIAANRLTRTDLPPVGGAPATAHTFLDLDDADPLAAGVQHDPTRSVGFPYSLTFAAAGDAYVTGLLTDNVIHLTAAGVFVEEFDLTAGAIPRGLLLYAGETQALVYCWGTNVIEAWQLAPPVKLGEYPLGHDPAPALVQQGRAVFYDASHSLHNNVSCHTCHVEGRTDLLAWNLSDFPMDDKGPMVTQTLVAIDRMRPFHWRGERRDLRAFNGAFPGLLGAPASLDETPGGEFDQFQAFVFSLQSPANPFQNPARRLDPEIQAPVLPAGVARGDAVHGLRLYQERVVLDSHACNGCHQLPLGTNHDLFHDDLTGKLPKRAFFKPVPFVENWRKLQPVVDPVILDPLSGLPVDPPQPRALLGSGLTHAGRDADLLAALEGFPVTEQERADLLCFLQQFDQGLAPVVHRGYLLNVSTTAETREKIQAYLPDEARRRNGDLVVFGRSMVDGSPRELRWVYDRETRLFLPEDSTVPARTLADFLAAAVAENQVFLGLPVGMGERFSVDFDEDGLFNGDELLHGTDPLVADSDGDSFPDGHEVAHGGDPVQAGVVPFDATPPVFEQAEVLWSTTKSARLRLCTDEPTQVLVQYATSVGDPLTIPENGLPAPEFHENHSILLDRMLPSTDVGPKFDYTVTVTALDHAGNATVMQLPAIRTGDFLQPLANPEVIVSDLQWTSFSRNGANLSAAASVEVSFKQGGPPALLAPDHAVVVRLFVNGAPATGVVPSGPDTFLVTSDFTLNHQEGFTDPFIPGPFLLSRVTDVMGATRLAFRINGLAPGDEIVFGIEAVIPVASVAQYQTNLAACGGTCATLDIPVQVVQTDLRKWVFADTPPEFRFLSGTF